MSQGEQRWQEVATGVHAWIYPPGGWGQSNAGLVLATDASDEALLFDAQWDEPSTTHMLQEAPLDRHRIGTLVNSHPDGDHTWGNAVVGAERIIATDACNAHFDHEDPQRLGLLVAAASRIGRAPLVRLPGPLRTVNGPHLLLRYLAAMGRGFDFGGVRLTWPTETFSGELDLTVGGRALTLIEVGPTHSHGDAILHLPADRVVFAADVLFVGVSPIMWVGPLSNWQAALATILALKPTVVVPGHGPVSGVAEVATFAEHLAWIAEVGDRQRTARRSPLDGAFDALTSQEYRSSPWADWISPERLVVTLTAMQREAENGPPIEGVQQRARLVTQMAVLADRLARASR
ncbi:MAG: MBL fold metallo-hydrolase [Solirubrobacteraceae bacterium]|nr:MBL fold metallo-hydrolase [Patulibacter sp.]